MESRDLEGQRTWGCSVPSIARMLLRALRPSKYHRFHWPMNLTYLEYVNYNNAYKKQTKNHRNNAKSPLNRKTMNHADLLSHSILEWCHDNSDEANETDEADYKSNIDRILFATIESYE